MIYKAHSFLKYLINGKTKFRIHSPYVYNFVINVLLDRRNYYAYDFIEEIKDNTRKNKETIEIIDLGAGASGKINKSRKVSDIVNSSAINRKYGQLLFRIVQHYKPTTILELGSCVGIGSLYLAAADSNIKLITIEGDPTLANITKANIKKYPHQLKNVECLQGNFDDLLEDVLLKNSPIDLAYVDGNHQFEPTIRYFNQIVKHKSKHSILIFDDIHWSAEMGKAWEEIKKHPNIALTLDIYRMGIVFFGDERKEKEHFQIYF